MSGLRKIRARTLLAAGLLLGSFLLLNCQPAQPAATPKPTEKPAAATTAAATPTKPAEKAAEKPVRGGTLRLLLASDPASLDPHIQTKTASVGNLYDYLIWFDTEVNVTKEGLFKDWTISGDGKSITFKLQSGVKFQDGTDLDAAAVKFNIDRMKDPATKSLFASNYVSVASVEVVDGLTVRFNLSYPDPLLLPRMGQQGGMMVSPAAVKKYGVDFARNPVGSGPFQFVEWVPGDHITMKRFEGYWGKDKAGNQLPYLDQVVFKTITEPSTGVANLRTGQMEMYMGSGGFPVEQLPLVKDDPSFTYSFKVSNAMSGVSMNTKKPPFDNKTLRQAVALAIDREGMAARLGQGATVWASIYHPINWGSDPKLVLPSRDLVKAKAKMAEAGYPSGGVKVKNNTANSPIRVADAQIVKANLVEIGIEVEIEAVSSATWDSKNLAGDFQISMGTTPQTLGDPGHIFSQAFHSKGSRNTFGPYGNPQVDQLVDKAGAIYDQKERTALYQEAVKIMIDDVPFVPNYNTNNLAVANKKVRNFVRYGDGGERLKEVWLAQ